MADGFEAELLEVDRAADPPQAFCDIVAEVFPVNGAAVSTLGNLLGTETLAESDAVAARLDELQFDLGEGPCWDAVSTGSAVLHPDIGSDHTRWPSLSEALVTEGVKAIFAFPLGVGPLRFGAIDLYSTTPMILNRTQTTHANAMAATLGRQVLRRAMAAIGADEDDNVDASAFSRRVIHQASGMVLAQIDVSADDARLVIQGHAFAHGRKMMEVAQDIISGELRFSRQSGRIEVDG